MQKIDRLGWAAGISIVSYGARIGIRVNDAAALKEIKHLLPPGWKRSPTAVVDHLVSVFVGKTDPRGKIRRYHLLYVNAGQVLRTLKIREVLDRLESELQIHVAEGARHRVFVHAGVVGWRGKAILFPGSSFSGKTTLVRECLRAGATYFSDEFAVLDRRGRVHPYPRSLAIREGEGKPIEKVSPRVMGAPIGQKSLPVGLVVVSRYQCGAKWRPRVSSPGQAMLALLANTVSARRQPAMNFAALKRVISKAPVLNGKRGEAVEVVDSILRKAEESAGIVR